MSDWPDLDFASEQPVYETLHMYLQLIGKLPTRLHPWINHGWHVALRVTPRGFVTRSLPAGSRHFTVTLDVCDEIVLIECDGGGSAQVALPGLTVSQLQSQLAGALETLDLPAPLHGGPNEVPERVLFKDDDRARPWDGDTIRRLHSAFRNVDRVFNAFRARYRGKSSPSHLFWGSLDLALTRFSGREAPEHPAGFPNLPDTVTREAYSHEVISAGFWAGGGGVDEAAFYAYAYPSPGGLGNANVSPNDAYWHAELGEFVLPYAAVTSADDPDRVLMAFLQSTFDAAAGMLDWPADLDTRSVGYGAPPAT